MSTELRSLWRARPRDRFVRTSCLALAILVAAGWMLGGFDFAETFNTRRAENLARFLAELRPYPLQGRAWDWDVAAAWAGEILVDRGLEAAAATLAISVLAIVLAGCAGSILALGAARTIACAEPFLSTGRSPSRLVRIGWRVLATLTRWSLVVGRAMPEYVLAFLLLAIFGPSAWPVVLALAIHNAGILGRLYAETIENLDPSNLRALRAAGAGRLSIAFVGVLPAGLARGLLYAFYRWETCVREATVLGLLGVVSLGYWIADARVRGQYDVFVFLIGLGVVLVLVGDLVSAAVRRVVR